VQVKRFSKRVLAEGGIPGSLKGFGIGIGVWRCVIAVAALVVPFVLFAADPPSPHMDPDHGVRRIIDPSAPKGSCSHCHELQALEAGEPPYPKALFTENANDLCFTAGGACHQLTPNNYPANETSRIPSGFPDAGYFEYNAAGMKIHGVEFRSRWPGETVYTDPSVVGAGRFASPHNNDPDMPRIDPQGNGSCLNCHNVHGSGNPFDMLVSEYGGIGGFDEPTYPRQYTLCFDCHSMFGPTGMDAEGRFIADYYDPTVNNDGWAGHQIRMNPDVALSWPAHIQVGDKLPCYDCHNPHGSRGYNGQGANAFLISDERPGWMNLTNTLTDPQQNRRFCFGCHIPADGIPGSIQVEGIVMNTVSSRTEHESTGIRGCFDCHGGDYGSSTSYNVHHPNGRVEE